MDAAQDELIRIYSRIMGISSNIPQGEVVLQEMGEEYDGLIDRASAAMQKDLSEFQIGDDYLTPSRAHYHAAPFRARVDALLSYLRAFISPETVQRIGFPTRSQQ